MTQWRWVQGTRTTSPTTKSQVATKVAHLTQDLGQEAFELVHSIPQHLQIQYRICLKKMLFHVLLVCVCVCVCVTFTSPCVAMSVSCASPSSSGNSRRACKVYRPIYFSSMVSDMYMMYISSYCTFFIKKKERYVQLMSQEVCVCTGEDWVLAGSRRWLVPNQAWFAGPW